MPHSYVHTLKHQNLSIAYNIFILKATQGNLPHEKS